MAYLEFVDDMVLDGLHKALIAVREVFYSRHAEATLRRVQLDNNPFLTGEVSGLLLAMGQIQNLIQDLQDLEDPNARPPCGRRIFETGEASEDGVPTLSGSWTAWYGRRVLELGDDGVEAARARRTASEEVVGVAHQ